LLGVLLLALVGAAPAADSASSVVLGTSPPGATDNCGNGAGNETIVPMNLDSTSPQYVATFDAVATSMTYSAASAPAGAQVRAVFARPAAAGSYTVSAKSELFPMVAGTVTTYPIRVSVQVGDYLGLNVKGAGVSVACYYLDDGSSIMESGSDVDSTSTLLPGISGNPGFPDISAVIEPDADRDGYGDASQDLCPTSALTHGACPPLDTTITSKPPRKTHKHKVKIGFSSPDPTARFECALDSKKRFTPCTSPRKVRAGLGKHTLLVRAVDPAGAVDPTPAKVSWRVQPRPSAPH
jgi:hypothetical protein